MTSTFMRKWENQKEDIDSAKSPMVTTVWLGCLDTGVRGLGGILEVLCKLPRCQGLLMKFPMAGEGKWLVKCVRDWTKLSKPSLGQQWSQH